MNHRSRSCTQMSPNLSLLYVALWLTVGFIFGDIICEVSQIVKHLQRFKITILSANWLLNSNEKDCTNVSKFYFVYTKHRSLHWPVVQNCKKYLYAKYMAWYSTPTPPPQVYYLKGTGTGMSCLHSQWVISSLGVLEVIRSKTWWRTVHCGLAISAWVSSLLNLQGKRTWLQIIVQYRSCAIPIVPPKVTLAKGIGIGM